jgi:hypothetical protein
VGRASRVVPCGSVLCYKLRKFCTNLVSYRSTLTKVTKILADNSLNLWVVFIWHFSVIVVYVVHINESYYLKPIAKIELHLCYLMLRWLDIAFKKMEKMNRCFLRIITCWKIKRILYWCTTTSKFAVALQNLRGVSTNKKYYRPEDWVYILRSWRPLQKMVTTQMYTFSRVFAILICTWPTHVKMTKKTGKAICWMTRSLHAVS